MCKYAEKFNQRGQVLDAKKQAAQNVRNHSQQIETTAKTFASQFCSHILKVPADEIDSRNLINVGPTKTLEAILRKGENAYSGDMSKVADGCRLQIFVDTPEEMVRYQGLIEKAEKQAQHNFKKHIKTSFINGKVRFLAQKNDEGESELTKVKYHTDKPKRWGWMGLMMKMEGEVGKNSMRAPFEVQIIHRDMKGAYDESHKLYSTIKSAMEDWDEHKDEVSVEDFFNYQYCREPYNKSATECVRILDTLRDMIDIHKTAAKRCGMDQLVEGEFPDIAYAKQDREYAENEIMPLNGYKELLDPNLGAVERLQRLKEALNVIYGANDESIAEAGGVAGYLKAIDQTEENALWVYQDYLKHTASDPSLDANGPA